MTDWDRQLSNGLRLGWGAAGAAALGPGVAALVIVDVLSFTTAVTVAAEAGTRVYPYPWRDDSAAEFARQRNAKLAVGRSAATLASPWSLSPAALRRAPAPAALVLPSPNGSAIAAAAAGPGSGGPISGGPGPRSPVIIAACLRNARATGRIAGPGTTAACLGAALAASVSGRELRAAGFADDVAVAAELDSAAIVPVLAGGAFRAESGAPENG